MDPCAFLAAAGLEFYPDMSFLRVLGKVSLSMGFRRVHWLPEDGCSGCLMIDDLMNDRVAVKLVEHECSTLLSIN